MKIVLATIAMVNCVACAPLPYQDSPKLRQCKYEAAMATASGGNYGTTNWVAAGYAEGLKRRKLIEMCMGR